MQKFVSIIALVSLLGLIIIYFQPFKLSNEAIVETDDYYDNCIKDMKLDSDDLLNAQKKIIIDNSLTLLKKFSNTNFIEDSFNPYVFERNLSNYSKLDYQSAPVIKAQGMLFLDKSNNYHIMINYLSPCNITGVDYLELKFSNHYQLSLLNHQTYLIYKNREYLDSTTSPNNDFNLYQFAIPNPKFRQYFKHPIVSGFYHFKLEAEAGYESTILSFIINIYNQRIINHEGVILGFNNFRSNPNEIRYIPRSLNVLYLKEDN
ncbi:MAG: hypothetical protein PHT03_07480 [Bacilli bacterium]|nr:hypothetical protein [Bacilli bacterium]